MSAFPEPAHFRDESEALHRLLGPMQDAGFAQATLFKRWTIDDILRHLHFWNGAAARSLADPSEFAGFVTRLRAELQRSSLREIENEALAPLRGRALLQAWQERCGELAERFAAADPKARLPWAGPAMSARSSISARLMETWAHAQAVYDLLGVERIDADRIQSIAHLGVNTFGWTFRNRGEDPPMRPPHVRLTAPSGVQWRWHEPDEENLVEGRATEFCQVVAQTRNIADTGLVVRGDAATRRHAGWQLPSASRVRRRRRPRRERGSSPARVSLRQIASA